MSSLPCTWTIPCTEPARFHVMAPGETLAELPTVCSRHLVQAVSTTARVYDTTDVTVRVHSTGAVQLGSASLEP